MHSRLLVALAVVMLAACSSAPSASAPRSSAVARPAPTADPTPTPEPSPWSSGWPEGGLDVNWKIERALEGELFDTCYRGAPVPGAAPYAGKIHPLVVVDMNNGWLADVDINEELVSTGWSWPSPIQLVVCARHDEKLVASCGSYTSESGEVGELARYRETMTIEVIVAANGRPLQKKAITNPAAKCPKELSVGLGNEWALRNPVTPEQVDAYATAVSKQAVK